MTIKSTAREVIRCHMDDAVGFTRVREELRAIHPELIFDRFDLADSETELRAAHGGVRVFWIYRGEGEVFLPDGYRTKEGDGNGLPDCYEPDAMGPALADSIEALERGFDRVRTDAQPAIRAILDRNAGPTLIGDFANDLWKLEHVSRPWSEDPAVETTIENLWLLCSHTGYSTKRGASFERIMEGDQLAVAGDESLCVRGSFACLSIEKPGATARTVPSAMRLRYLCDSSGGCNFDFDPFRRLPLTWQMQRPGDTGDGANFANSHVVNIAKETSPSHFHPPIATGGGKAQHEIYLVLDPAAYGLSTHGRRAQLYTWPDLNQPDRMTAYDVAPGDFIHIPPGVGHRGIDVFVNVITVPGFKPHNEYYIDADLRDSGNGVPFNDALVHLKNYDCSVAQLAQVQPTI